MSIFTYHLVKINLLTALKFWFFPPNFKKIEGLIHIECMTTMTLGSAIFSPSRMLFNQMAVFAQWENEEVLDSFLKKNNFGKKLLSGWYLRLQLIRQWGRISKFKIPENIVELVNVDSPVVAVTLARMKLIQVPRFIKWGRPVEKLVRDHPGTTLALGSIRLPRLVSIFSVWESSKQMLDMVHGHSAVSKPERHSNAMKERNRKDFHVEFTTLRFQPISEFGVWNNRTNIIPNLKSKMK